MISKLSIIYKDNDIVVVDKPPGMLSVGDRFTFNIPSVLSNLRKNYGEVLTVHRLDKDTSGLLVFALNAEAHRHLSMAFEGREVEKHYIALVEGIPPQNGEIHEALAESPFVKGKMVVYKKGKPSSTLYTKIDQFGQVALLDVHILTGRTHQIRVHMAHIGHPLFIDTMYGRREEFFLSEFKGRNYKTSKKAREKPLINRLSLHAHTLCFTHPITKEQLNLVAELPKDIKAFINQAKKHCK
jgi:23S rRNA pseudouridine1911/1915/1917 synthase